MLKGGVVCDYLNRKYWGDLEIYKNLEPLETMKKNGFNAVRVGVTMNSVSQYTGRRHEELKYTDWTEKSWSCIEYAEQILREADQLGMSKVLFFFLSNEAAHGDKQKTPEEWKDLTMDEIGERLCEYTYKAAKYYLDAGIKIDIYEIGNEIERGILDFRPMEKIPAPDDDKNQFWNVDYYQENIWNLESKLLKKAIEGVKKADPGAVIGLHIAGVGWSENDVFLKGFYDSMDSFGVPYDVIGLSYYWGYPISDILQDPYYSSGLFANTLDYLAARGKKIIFSEWAYPNNPAGTLNNNDNGYDFTPEGQALWVRHFLDFCEINPHVIGSFYFYPEYCKGFSGGKSMLLDSCGLFENYVNTTPALKEFNSSIKRNQ